MKKLPDISKECLFCHKYFVVRETSDRKFCSQDCFREDWKTKIPGWNRGIKTGQIPWNKGKKIAYKPRLSRRGIRVSEDTEFKYTSGSGSNVVLHNWVKRNLGKPNKCDFCQTTEKRMYHWANRSGDYKRELSDWLRLCVPCHKNYDYDRKKRRLPIT